MPDPRPAAHPRGAQRSAGTAGPLALIVHPRNGRLHLALLVALAAAFIIALGVPISRIHAGGTEPDLASESGETPATLDSQSSVLAAELARSRAGEAAAAVPVQRQQAIAFTIHEQGLASRQLSRALTVGQALAELGIRLQPQDAVSPHADSALTPGLHIYVRHASRIELTVGGVYQSVYSLASTVGDLLRERGIALEPADRVVPPAGAALRNGMSVDVTTVRRIVEQVDDPIPFDTIYWDGPDLPQGSEEVVRGGEPGYVRSEYRVLLVNGVEASRQLIGEARVEPTNEILAVGSYVAPRPAPAPVSVGSLDPGQPCTRTMTVYATWYTAASAGGNGRTATGTGVYRGIIAVDPRVIPLGTRMYVPGYGHGIAADTGGGIIGNMIDLGYGANDVYDWRTRWIDICVFG